MTKQTMFAVIAAAVVSLSIGCARETPLAPSGLSNEVAIMETTELTASSTPTVTLMPDLTASPQQITVAAGTRVKMVNQSGRYAKVQSYNCSEFSGVNLPNGGWVNTWAFTPAGKTCDYFVWEANYARKLFEGQVIVR